MNTNDNTEPCPTCSMAANKSAIKLAARVAELERALRLIVEDARAEDVMRDSVDEHLIEEARALLEGWAT
jgi:hypothetical protein